MLSALTRAEGVSRFCETVFENRFGYASQLRRLGAQIRVTGRYARLAGGAALHGGELEAEDLRGAAALTIAAMTAEGRTLLHGVEHLRRGYSAFPEKLRALGARVEELEL